MGKNSFIIIIAVLWIFLIFPGCRGILSRPESAEDYRQGEVYAMEVAKRDAMADHCFNISPNYRMRILVNRNRHLEEIRKTRSSSFISGFFHKYAYGFHEYMELYCRD